MSDDRRRHDDRVDPPSLPPARVGAIAPRPNTRAVFVTRAEFDEVIAALREELTPAREIEQALHPSLPPLRRAMDTDSFKINLKELETALEIEREKFRAYEKTKLTEELHELKSQHHWWRDNGVKWFVSGVGAVGMLVLGYLLSLLTSRPK